MKKPFAWPLFAPYESDLFSGLLCFPVFVSRLSLLVRFNPYDSWRRNVFNDLASGLGDSLRLKENEGGRRARVEGKGVGSKLYFPLHLYNFSTLWSGRAARNALVRARTTLTKEWWFDKKRSARTCIKRFVRPGPSWLTKEDDEEITLGPVVSLWSPILCLTLGEWGERGGGGGTGRVFVFLMGLWTFLIRFGLNLVSPLQRGFDSLFIFTLICLFPTHLGLEKRIGQRRAAVAKDFFFYVYCNASWWNRLTKGRRRRETKKKQDDVEEVEGLQQRLMLCNNQCRLLDRTWGKGKREMEFWACFRALIRFLPHDVRRRSVQELGWWWWHDGNSGTSGSFSALSISSSRARRRRRKRKTRAEPVDWKRASQWIERERESKQEGEKNLITLKPKLSFDRTVFSAA